MIQYRTTAAKVYAGRLFLATCILLLTCTLAGAESPDRQVWLISTRAAPRSSAPDPAHPRIRFWELRDNAWAPSEREAFHASDRPEVPTVFLIHGNRTRANEAVRIGSSFRRHLTRSRRNGPFRLVIWSWPSEEVCGRVRADVQLKAHYSDIQAVYLAECLREMPAEQPATFVGYSFGARVITGALELIGGGQVCGYRLPEAPALREAPWQAVLIAAALDAHWLSPGARNGRAVGQLDRMLIIANPADRVMRLYPRMYRRRGPEALGYYGSGYRLAPADRGKVRRLDVSCEVGREHGWWSYWRSGSLRAALVRYAFETP